MIERLVKDAEFKSMEIAPPNVTQEGIDRKIAIAKEFGTHNYPQQGDLQITAYESELVIAALRDNEFNCVSKDPQSFVGHTTMDGSVSTAMRRSSSVASSAIRRNSSIGASAIRTLSSTLSGFSLIQKQRGLSRDSTGTSRSVEVLKSVVSLTKNLTLQSASSLTSLKKPVVWAYGYDADCY